MGGGPGGPGRGRPGAGHAPDRFGQQPAPAGSPGPLPPSPPRRDRVQLPGRPDGPHPHGQAGPGPPHGHPQALGPPGRPAGVGPEPGSPPGNLDVGADVPASIPALGPRLPLRQGALQRLPQAGGAPAQDPEVRSRRRETERHQELPHPLLPLPATHSQEHSLDAAARRQALRAGTRHPGRARPARGAALHRALSPPGSRSVREFQRLPGLVPGGHRTQPRSPNHRRAAADASPDRGRGPEALRRTHSGHRVGRTVGGGGHLHLHGQPGGLPRLLSGGGSGERTPAPGGGEERPVRGSARSFH